MLISHIKAATTPTTTSNSAASGTSATSTSSAAGSSGASGISLGGTDFLTLMLAQLKNQDPTSPIDSNAFLTQLAQLSEVQGIQQLNTSFSSSLQANQTLQASSLLGHQVLASSSTATLASGGTVTGAVQVPQNTSAVTVDVLDGSGTLVQQISLGAQSTGLANFTWNGTESNGSQAPAGTYSLKATVDGVPSTTAISTYVNGTVDSVTMASGTSGLILNVAGVGSVPFSSVTQIAN
jgi:flagellar basal-body rod modification protein FlgD